MARKQYQPVITIIRSPDLTLILFPAYAQRPAVFFVKLRIRFQPFKYPADRTAFLRFGGRDGNGQVRVPQEVGKPFPVGNNQVLSGGSWPLAT